VWKTPAIHRGWCFSLMVIVILSIILNAVKVKIVSCSALPSEVERR
jgi:hypothetical protein